MLNLKNFDVAKIDAALAAAPDYFQQSIERQLATTLGLAEHVSVAHIVGAMQIHEEGLMHLALERSPFFHGARHCSRELTLALEALTLKTLLLLDAERTLALFYDAVRSPTLLCVREGGAWGPGDFSAVLNQPAPFAGQRYVHTPISNRARAFMAACGVVPIRPASADE